MVRACYGALHAARAYGTPFISGKDSLNNEFKTQSGESIAIPHTLLISAIGKAVSLDALTTTDLKQAGNKLLLVGLTRREFAASHHELVTGVTGHEVPRVNPAAALELFRAVNAAQREGLVASAHDCAEGGLAVTLAEMCIGGRLGARAALRQEMAATDNDISDETLLFAESNSRFVLEVRPEHEARLYEIFDGLPLFGLGEVTDSLGLEIKGLDGQALISAAVEDLHRAWHEPLYKAVGE
jgi:phosphoribosylformylglycinamidine synthase subunit PurSL